MTALHCSSAVRRIGTLQAAEGLFEELPAGVEGQRDRLDGGRGPQFLHEAVGGLSIFFPR